MTIQEAIQYCRDHATDYLQQDGQKTGYICPICNSGAGHNGTGIKVKDDKIHFTCFANNCFSNADIIDIIAIEHGIQNADFITQLKQACDVFHITLDEQAEDNKPAAKQTNNTEVQTMAEQDTPKQDYIEYYKQCIADLPKTDYWQGRGISSATCKKFHLGYDKGHRAVVIPIDRYTYKTRSIEGKTFYNSKGGSIKLFNTKALNNNNVVYVCEAEIDALSVEEMGKPAIALRGVSNAKRVKDIAAGYTDLTLLLCLDNDKAGDKATEEIQADMHGTGVKCIDIRPLFAGYTKTTAEGNTEPIKDINELLVNNKEALAGLLSLEVAEVEASIKGLLAADYIKQNSASAFINEFIDGVKDSVNTPPIATGFNNLDAYLDGGLREGLYTIGAISSLGKTTFIMQMADNMAAQGNDVIIITLEMSKTELMAKSFSRNTYTYCIENNVNINPYAKSNIAITDGTKYPFYNADELHIIKKAINKYSEYSNHIFYVENNGQLGIADVEKVVQQHYDITGNEPVVILDYLQLLAPPQERLTDKQAVDMNIVKLKHISRVHKTPVIAISSFNRANYNTKVTMEAFKETGNIDYTSNAMFGMQLKGVGNDKFDVNAAKSKNPRQIELVVLKNRNGQTGGTLQYEYYPQFNYFREV